VEIVHQDHIDGGVIDLDDRQRPGGTGKGPAHRRVRVTRGFVPLAMAQRLLPGEGSDPAADGIHMRALEARIAAPTGHLMIGIGDRMSLIVEIDFCNGRGEELFHFGIEPPLPWVHAALGGNEGGQPPATTIVLPPAI
jgi:hypothetical protein